MLSPEDKRLIAEYMGWEIEFDYYVSHTDKRVINYDSNDASLCVEKMVAKKDIRAFEVFLSKGYVHSTDEVNFIAYLFNPGNFFSAMASWLRGKQYTPSIRTR